jgi:hypothetical protein
MGEIKTIEDLANLLWAAPDDASIARRIYKATNCGCPAGVKENHVVGKEDVIYTLKCGLSILGWMVQTWRAVDGKDRKAKRVGEHALPSFLKTYLDISPDPDCKPVIGSFDGIEAARRLGRKWMEGLELDDTLLRKTMRGSHVYLTIKAEKPIIGACFWVTGYCEGSDWEHEPYELEFPFTEDELWKAVGQADKDGCETWDRTHGCEHCQTADCKVEEVEGKGWRISWNDGESWWKGGSHWKPEADRNGSEAPITYRTEEWEVRVDFSEAMDEYGVIAINNECGHCEGQGRRI